MSEPNLRQVRLDSLGVGIGVGLYGVTFGALATSSGLSVTQAVALSMLMFTGASQFAFLGVVAAGGTPWAGALTATLLGTRNLFYGFSMARDLDEKGLRRAANAHLIIDESTAMAISRQTRSERRTGFYWTGITIFVIWNLMTFIGAIAGNAIGDPKQYGLDGAVAAAFLGLLWPRLTTRSARFIAVIAVGATLCLTLVLPAGMPIIVGGLIAAGVGLLIDQAGAPCDD